MLGVVMLNCMTRGSPSHYSHAHSHKHAHLLFFHCDHLLRFLGKKTVPCGIFDDPAMVNAMKEDAATIRKGMVQSKELHGSMGSDLLAMNQVVRVSVLFCYIDIHVVDVVVVCKK